MAEICPAVLQDNPAAYKIDLERVSKFAKRIQIDVADGIFAPSKTINLAQVYWPDKIKADIHLMLEEPAKELETLISLQPHLAIIHAEAKGDLKSLLQQFSHFGIKAGVALLPDTSIESVHELVQMADHVLIFGGKLGYYGGALERSCLPKAKQAKKIKPSLELGWDGGVNDENAAELVESGYDVLNVGGYIQKAEDSKKAYNKLVEIAQKVG